MNAIKYVLLGKWLGHPLHPAIVHVPIALWVGACIFDIMNLGGLGGNSLVRTSFWSILLGLVATLVVVPAGFAEWSEIKREKPAWKLALWHMILNVITMLIFVASLALRWGDAYDMNKVPMGAAVLCFVATAVLGVSGYLGGRMVYEHGIGIGRESKTEYRALAAKAGANLPAKD